MLALSEVVTQFVENLILESENVLANVLVEHWPLSGAAAAAAAAVAAASSFFIECVDRMRVLSSSLSSAEEAAASFVLERFVGFCFLLGM